MSKISFNQLDNASSKIDKGLINHYYINYSKKGLLHDDIYSHLFCENTNIFGPTEFNLKTFTISSFLQFIQDQSKSFSDFKTPFDM